MAQQVKFHEVSESAYAALDSKGNGDLYFITDNGEIRKGDNHITGTRVFTANDSTGTTPVKYLDIKIDNVSIGTPAAPAVTHTVTAEEAGTGDYADNAEGDVVTITEETSYAPTAGVEQPKRGDMLVVNGAGGLSAYVYNRNGNTYTHEGWLACSSGTLDASKIVLTDDLKMAGDYDKIGNFVKTTEGQTLMIDGHGTQGMTFQEVLDKMFSQIIQPSTTLPTASLTVTNTSYDVEVGTTVTPTFSVGLTDGKYSVTGQTDVSAGCAINNDTGVTTYVLTGVKSGDENKSSGSVVSFTATTSTQTHTVTATVEYKAGTAQPIDNIGGNATISKIAAGKTAAASKTVTVKGFYKQYLYVGTDCTSEVTGAWIKANATSAAKSISKTNVTIPDGTKRVVIALPTGSTITKVIDVDGMGLDIIEKFPVTSGVTIAAAGSASTTYNVYVFENPNGVVATRFTFS